MKLTYSYQPQNYVIGSLTQFVILKFGFTDTKTSYAINKLRKIIFKKTRENLFNQAHVDVLKKKLTMKYLLG